MGVVSDVAVLSQLAATRFDPEGRMRLFSGPRPDNPDEHRAWKWGWHFMYAVLAVLLSMIAFPVTAWLTGK